MGSYALITRPFDKGAGFSYHGFMFKKIPRDIIILTAIAALGVSLRLINIQDEPFWGDEILSLSIVKHFAGSIPEMLRYLKEVEIHPPLYYLLLTGWMRLFGEGEANIRILSVLLGAGTIFGTFFASKALFRDSKVALISASALAILPLQMELDQEARPYAAGVFFMTIAMIFLWKYLRGGKATALVVYGIAAAAAIHLHYSFILPTASMSAWWIIESIIAGPGKRKIFLRDWLLTHGAVFLCFFWWLDAFIFKLMLAKTQFVGITPRASSVVMRPLGFIEKFPGQMIWVVKAKDKLLPVIEVAAQAIVKLVAVWFAYGMYKTARRDSSPETPEGRPVLFVLWLLFATAFIFMISPLSYEYTPLYERQAVFAVIPIVLLIGKFIGSLPARRAIVMASLFTITLLPRIADVAGNDEQWDSYYQLKPAAAYINQHHRPGDSVLISWWFSRVGLNYYLRQDISAEGLLPVFYDPRVDWRASRDLLGFIENELQLRIPPIDKGLMVKELEGYIDRNGPNRIWLYGFGPDKDIEKFFLSRGWRQVLTAWGGISNLSLYSSK